MNIEFEIEGVLFSYCFKLVWYKEYLFMEVSCVWKMILLYFIIYK